MHTYHLIGCEVLREECERILRESGNTAVKEFRWLEMGLHDKPEELNLVLRDELAKIEPGSCEAVLLLFGLCSNATLNLAAPGVPMVVPRVHDCISLYLGSAGRYQDEHEKEPGTYWFSRGFMHRKDSGGGLMGHAPGEEEFTPTRRNELYQEYCREYGEDNAQYLMETWVDAWKRNYTRAVMVSWDYPELEQDRVRVRELAESNGWRYEEIPANLRLVEMLIAGNWPKHEFLVLRPGQQVQLSHDCKAITCADEATVAYGNCRPGSLQA